jgi:hypothetical protein
MLSPRDILLRRKREVEVGINVLMAAGFLLAAQDLEGVLCDLDAQILGIEFKETHGEEC